MILTRRKLHPMTEVIAVMTYNQPEMVWALMQELSPYLLVIDNGSTVPIPNTRIRVPENRYFAGGWNYAMQQIDADWVAMLNDDITGITVGMISDLIDTAIAHDYAAISPAFNSPHPHMQPQGKGLRRVHSIDWVATIVRKKAWDDVGGFNEAFPGYGSDLEWAYRAKQKGYRLAVDDRYCIHHIGGAAAIAGGTQHIQGNVTSMNEAFNRLYSVPDWMAFTQQYLMKDFS